MQKDCQTVFAHPAWKGAKLGDITAAWYQREIAIPADWAGRRITLYAECLNSYAAVYLDGKKAGEMRFPGGEVDLTAQCRPGGSHTLSMLVIALPLKAVMLSHSDTFGAKEVRGTVRASRPVRRPLADGHAGRSSHRGRQGGHLGAPLGDHVRGGARGAGRGWAVRPEGAGLRRGPSGP